MSTTKSYLGSLSAKLGYKLPGGGRGQGARGRPDRRAVSDDDGLPLNDDRDIGPIHAPPRTRQQAAREKLIEAKERERRNWRRVQEARRRRIEKLREEHTSIDRWCTLLARIEPEVEAYSGRDCDHDLAPLARRLALDTLPQQTDRYLVYTLAADMIRRRCIAQKIDYLDDADVFGESTGQSVLDELAILLKITG